MIRNILRLVAPAILAMLPLSAAADEADLNCFIEALPYWEITEIDATTLRAARVVPNPQWVRGLAFERGDVICGKVITKAAPVYLNTAELRDPTGGLLAESWVVRLSDSLPEHAAPNLAEIARYFGIKSIEDQGFSGFSTPLDPDVWQIDFTPAIGIKGLAACDGLKTDHVMAAASLPSFAAAGQSYDILDFQLLNTATDPMRRQQFETINPPQVACQLTLTLKAKS